MQDNQLDYLKEKYNNSISKVINAVRAGELDIETLNIPVSFKRLHFVQAKNDIDLEVSESDFYGNISVQCKLPKTVSAISLMTIHKLTEMGYDRYGTIMAIKKLTETSTSTANLIDDIVTIVPNALEKIK